MIISHAPGSVVDTGGDRPQGYAHRHIPIGPEPSIIPGCIGLVDMSSTARPVAERWSQINIHSLYAAPRAALGRAYEYQQKR